MMKTNENQAERISKAGVLHAMALLSSLWSNYKPPASEQDLDSAANAWCLLLDGMPEELILRVICDFSREGAEFAPQVGMIYERARSLWENECAVRESYALLSELNGSVPKLAEGMNSA